MSSSKGQFEAGYQPDVQHQKPPGTEAALDPAPIYDQVPTPEGGKKPYQASGKLQGRKAIITGGDSGIGRAAAVLFALEGADSLIAYLPEEEQDAQETKRLVEEKGKKCFLFAADLKKKENCQKVIDEALAKLGAINILFNNHAFQMMQDNILKIPDEQWLSTFDTNIHSFFFLSKYALPHMKHGDVIINNASVNAYIGRPDLLDYTSTKGAVVSFTRGLSNQWVSKGIRVNAVAPGPVWTPLIPATMNTQAIKEFTSPMGRPGQPSEVATCVVFLASTDSSLLSGQVLHCNGGVIVNG